MLFPTFTFMLFFFPLTAIVYFLLGRKNTAASQLFLVLASIVFYSWFHWSYSLLLIGSIFVNHFFAQWLYKNNSKLILTAGILCNVLALGYFKYYDFFVENINAALGTSFHLKHILLPLGISFFTFQQISFLQLVYSRQLAKRYNLLTYSLFVCFFPQLIAGPIVLPDEMMSQFDKKENLIPNAGNIAAGLYAFALGLGKKILLADFFAEIADAGFAGISGNFFESWQTALAYTFQIYFDFSGYCDMAIGIAMVFNIFLPQNFSAPYRADNITDFWRKWHMTLGRFLMTTIYIPLGGNRKGTIRTYFNLLITFFISGLWHGASWLFVLWGMMHGAALILHRIWNRVFGLKMPLIPARLLTFFFVLLAWVPFRAVSWKQAEKLYSGMFLPDSLKMPAFSAFDAGLFIAGAVIIIFLKPVPELAKKFRPTWFNALTAAVLMIVSMFFFVKTSPFIYFNF